MRTVCLVSLLVPLLAFGADRVAFAPASQMVGEVKRLERGRLYFKTDATDTIPIEWEDVVALVSNQQLQIELTSGARFLGQLIGSDPSHVTVAHEGSTTVLPMNAVVKITPIEKTFLERWDVDLSAGYAFTKASDVTNLNFGLDTKYTTEKRRVTLDAELETIKDSARNTTRWQVTTENRRLRENRWFHGYFATLEGNDGLGLDLRTSLGVGGGRYLWQTNSLNFGVLGAILGSREEIEGTSSVETTFEGLFAAEFELFRYDSPEIDVTTRLAVIPNLSDFGRVRIEYDLALRWELMNDFFWEIKFYDSFDSDPPAVDADKNDYGITTGIVWEL